METFYENDKLYCNKLRILISNEIMNEILIQENIIFKFETIKLQVIEIL